MNKFLTGCIAVETRNARLNGSSKDVEGGGSTVQNVAYTKKIRSRNGTFPYASGVYIKKNIKKYAEMNDLSLSSVRSISTTEAYSEGNPFMNYDEDVMGFMIAGKLVLSEDEFNELTAAEQDTFKRTTKGKKVLFEKNITKKRKARLMVSPLQAISSTRVQEEFNVRQTDKTNLLYTREIYANIMSMGFNLDINNVGVYRVSEDESGFRDYSTVEAESYGYSYGEDGMIELDKADKTSRISTTLRAMQFFNSDIAQANNLEDLSSKFVILAEYRIGNNIFNNIFRSGSLDIDYLIEAIEENEDYRLSNIYIGIRKGFMSVEGVDLREVLEARFEGNKDVIIGTVGDAFDKYIDSVK